MDKRQLDQRISLISDNWVNDSVIEDKEYLFLFKKTEKIVMATHILSDFIPDTESLQRSFKDNVCRILDSVCKLLHDRPGRGDIAQEIKARFIQLMSLYNLAEISGYITQMNGGVIRKEIGNLLVILDSLERDLEDERAPEMKQNYFNIDVRSKRQYKQHSELQTQGSEKDKIYKRQDKGQIGAKKTYNVSYNRPPESLIRSTKIFDVIKEKGNVSIKDISSIVLDCSEKTIQRTLNNLIAAGKIQKIGERRWARYEIVS